MTREEELDWLCRLRSEIYVYMPKEWLIPMNNALDMAINALEQEPSEDLISRQAVIEICNEEWDSDLLVERIEQLPSVKQEPKTGHWIPTYGNVKCSVCGSVKESRRVGKATHYCDFCGARMESEGSE